ncbi:MAG: sigma-54-dependent Fis family transcriptional regulator [Spirochaetota bacterium]
MTSDHRERSFRRCREFGIEPQLLFPRRILGEAELRERLARKRDLIVAAEPFISRLYDFVRGSGFFAILTDEEGCILSVIGDEDILSEAFALRMVPGAFMDEASVGTNAMGTTLVEGRPLQVSGDEHFIASYHRWTCSAAPVRNAEGRVIGTLDLTGSVGKAHPHTLGMVVAAACAIETALVLASRDEALGRNERFTAALLLPVDAGLVSAAPDGAILSADDRALAMFGWNRAEMAARGTRGILHNWDEIRSACIAGRDFRGTEVPVEARANRLSLDLSASPVRGPAGVTESLVLVFRDVRRGRRHALDILHRRAIYTFDKILGRSRAILEAIEFARKIADSRSTVLITGESGTGKEIFAQAIQNASPRRDGPFVVLNCAAIPPTLIESELFGYADGAFTGARKGGQAGKFEIADGGSIFLDEIGDMPLEMQTRLLRVIEEGTVTRVGDSRELPVDVRIIAATNNDLASLVAAGRFRKDLFYRLNVLPIHLPALRERREDIPLLIDHYMERISRKLNKKPVPIGEAELAELAGREWPGNIRELENFVELVISSERLPDFVAPASWRPERPLPELPQRTGSLRDAERERISAVLAECGGNISRAAKRLTIGRNTLYRKMKLYEIECSNMEQ